MNIIVIANDPNAIAEQQLCYLTPDEYTIHCRTISAEPTDELLQKTDVIVLCHETQDGSEGQVVLKNLRRNRKNRRIPVVVLHHSDMLDEDVTSELRAVGAVRFISMDTEATLIKTTLDATVSNVQRLGIHMLAGMARELKDVLRTAKHVLLSMLSKEHRVTLIFATVMMLVAGVLTNVPAVVLGYLVDTVLEQDGSTFGDALSLVLVIVAAIIVREALTVYRKYLVENTCTRVDKEERLALVSGLLRADLRYIQGFMVGALQGRIARSIEGLVRLLKLMFLDFFPATFAALAALAIASYKSPIVGLLMFLIVPCAFMIILAQISSQKGIRIRLLRAKEDIDGKTVELLGELENVRAMNTSSRESKVIEGKADVLRAQEIRHHIWMAMFDAVKTLNEGFFYIVVLIVSLFMAFRGYISTGDVLTYSVLFLSVMQPLREMHRILDESHESYLRIQDLLELHRIPEDRSFTGEIVGAKQASEKASLPLINVQNLYFDYIDQEGNSSGLVLDNVSCSIDEGQRIGIAGASGCGKSTFIKILLRLLHYDQGEIHVGSRELRGISRAEVSAMFGYVSQRPLIISGTIHDNLVYGMDRKFSLDEIIEAAKMAMIHEEIVNDLGGYYGLVYESGKNLSGGQMQRIAIARLFLRAPRVLILDEATAALDNINEKMVQESLYRVMSNRTVIVIAHRLSTLINCDNILVFSQGRIAEEGKYDELLSKKGLFWYLDSVARSQAAS